MRVIAGSLGGRTFDSPRGHRTHPMSEKARGASPRTAERIAWATVNKQDGGGKQSGSGRKDTKH